MAVKPQAITSASFKSPWVRSTKTQLEIAYNLNYYCNTSIHNENGLPEQTREVERMLKSLLDKLKKGTRA